MRPVEQDRRDEPNAREPWPDDQDTDEVVRILRALGHPLRFRIIQVLAHRDSAGPDDPCGECEVVCASRLRLRFGVSAPDLTHHMKILDAAGLVEVHRDGNWVRYELRTSRVSRLAATMTQLTVTS